MKTNDEWNAEATADIIEHMNEDHSDAVDLFIRAFGDVDGEASEVKMTGMNQDGIELSYQLMNETKFCQLSFSEAGVNSPLQNRSVARSALVAMVKNARDKLNVSK